MIAKNYQMNKHRNQKGKQTLVRLRKDMMPKN